jgi:hypothetical protein
MKKNSTKILYILLIIFIIGISIFIFIKLRKKSDKYTIPKSLKSSLKQKHSFKTVNSFNKFTLSQNRLKQNTENFNTCLDTIPNFYSYLGFLGKGYNLYKQDINNIKTIGKSTLDIEYTDYTAININVDLLGPYTTVNTATYKITSSLTDAIKQDFAGEGKASFGEGVSTKTNASLIIGKEITENTQFSTFRIYNENSYSTASIPTNRYSALVNKNMLDDIKMLANMLADILNKDPNGNIDNMYYESFISKYGSHFINQINFGSKIDYWLSITSSETSNEDTLEVGMCLEGGYMKDKSKYSGGLDVKTEQTDKTVLSNSNVIRIVDVRGGSTNLRADLISSSSITLKQISDFISSGFTYPSKTKFLFTPIWELIKSHLTITDKNDAYNYCSLKGLNDSQNNKRKDNCIYLTFADKLKYYYNSKANSTISDITDTFLLNSFNNQCVDLNSSDGNALYLKPCEQVNTKFNGNIYDNILISGTNNCLQSENDAIFGAKIIANNNGCNNSENKTKMWKYDTTDNSIKWKEDNNMCLESIIDFKIDETGEQTFGPDNGRLTLNNCNGTSMQQWNFTNDVSKTLPPLPNNNDTPTPDKKYCKSWDIRTLNGTTYNLYLSPNNIYYLNYYPCSSKYVIQGGPICPYNGYYQWTLNDGVKTDILKLDIYGTMYMNDIMLTSTYYGWEQRDYGLVFMYKNWSIGMNYDIVFSGNDITSGINSWNNENPPLINTPIKSDHYTNNNLTLLSSGIPGVDGLQIQFQYDKVLGGNIGYNIIDNKPKAKSAEPIEKPVFGCNMWVVKTKDSSNNYYYDLIQWNDDEDRNVWKINNQEINNTNIYIAPLSMYTDNYSYNINFGIKQNIVGGKLGAQFGDREIIKGGGGNMLFQNLYKNNQAPYIGDSTTTWTYTLDGYIDGVSMNKYQIEYKSSSNIKIKNCYNNCNTMGYDTINPQWNGNILTFELRDSNNYPYSSGYIVFGNDMGPDKIFFASINEIDRRNNKTEYIYTDIRPQISVGARSIKGETLPPSNIIPVPITYSKWSFTCSDPAKVFVYKYNLYRNDINGVFYIESLDSYDKSIYTLVIDDTYYFTGLGWKGNTLYFSDCIGNTSGNIIWDSSTDPKIIQGGVVKTYGPGTPNQTIRSATSNEYVTTLNITPCPIMF